MGSLEVNSVLTFEDGIGVTKFSNVKASDGTTPYSPNGVLVNTDFPLFRLAEMFLIYTEAVKRGGTGGNDATALTAAVKPSVSEIPNLGKVITTNGSQLAQQAASLKKAGVKRINISVNTCPQVTPASGPFCNSAHSNSANLCKDTSNVKLVIHNCNCIYLVIGSKS